MVPLRFLSPLFLACALLSAGCGQQRELKEIYPVRGKVLFEGKSPQGARVVFHPAGNPDPRAILPHAEVGADGTFVMSTCCRRAMTIPPLPACRRSFRNRVPNCHRST